MVRQCSKCGLAKEEIEFNFKNKKKGKRRTACNECSKEECKAHYRSNPEYYKEKRQRRRKATRAWMKEVKESVTCQCGENHPSCIVFHHQNPDKKEINLSMVVNAGWSFERIQKEIDKCTPMCFNCHQKLHWGE